MDFLIARFSNAALASATTWLTPINYSIGLMDELVDPG
jgi:hypothetical protein